MKMYFENKVCGILLLVLMLVNGEETMVKVLSFTELNTKLKDPKLVLLDVREPAELKTDGKIPRSNNIPLGEFSDAIQMADGNFKGKYGFQKPQPLDNIVVYCKKGARAQTAANVLLEKGYSKVEVYPGILDWLQNGGKVEK